MDPWLLLFVAIISYLLGSISFGRVLMRLLKPGENLESVEMPIPGVEEKYKLESVGGNTVSLKLGARAGCLAWGAGDRGCRFLGMDRGNRKPDGD